MKNILLLEPGPTPLDLFTDPQEFQILRVGGNRPCPFRDFRRILQLANEGWADLLIVTQREQALLPPGAGWLRGGRNLVRALFKERTELFILLLFAKAVQRGIPIALVNRSDNGRLLPGTDWFYRRCHVCFIRELHPMPELALQHLFTPTGGNPQSNKRARHITSWFDPHCPLRRDIDKLRPISLGTPVEKVKQIDPKKPKTSDVFFAGDVNERGLRGRLLRELTELAQHSEFKISLRDRLTKDEYLEAVASSHLCLSPPGMGWECWRHYEALLAGSIPLMTYPPILQYKPGVDGEHCFYFPPDPGGLTMCVEKALARRERLPAMAEAGRKLVLENHTYPKLRNYIINETLAAFSQAK